MNQPENIKSLIAMLSSPIAEDNRLCEAAQYLRISGDKRAIGPLYKRLAEMNDAPWTRVELVNALSGLMISNHLAHKQINHLFLDILAEKTEPDEVKEAAALALGKLGDNQAVEPILILLNRALKDEQAGLIYTCVNTLGQLKDPRAVPVLIRTLFSKDELICKLGAETLGEFSKDAFPALPRLYELENSYRGLEKQAAREAILKIKKSISSGIC